MPLLTRGGLAVPLPPATLNTGLIATHAYLAVGFFGPPRLRSSGSYTYVHAWVGGHDTAWGWALAAGAVLSLAAPWLRRWGATAARVLAAAPLIALVAAYTGAQVAGLSEGWGSLLIIWPIAGHALLVAARHHPETRRA